MNKENKVTQVYTYRWLFGESGKLTLYAYCEAWRVAMAPLTHDPVIVQQQQHYM